MILVTLISVLTVGAPLNLQGIKRADAVYAVEIVGDTTVTEWSTLAENVTTAAENIVQTYFASWDNFKESVLDPLFWMLANQLISNMLSNLTQWINSGFQGSPAFVTDVEGFLQDAVDQAVGDFINSTDELGFLCSPFALDVKLALDIQYQASKSFGEHQCTLSDITGNIENFIAGNFSEGGWAGWFELSVSPTNDPNRAFLEGRTYASILARRTRDREFGVLRANEFFLNVQACEPVEVEPGTGNTSEQKCEDSTLGNIVQDHFVKVTGAPVERITFADEFNEVIGALMGQFVNQMLTGVNGLLGMGGTSYASGGGYGSTGELSYLDALAEESFNQTLDDSTDPIGDAIDQQIEYIAVLEELIAMIDEVEAELNAARQRYPGCFNVRMTPELTDARDNALNEIFFAEETINIYLAFEEELRNAASTEERIEIMTEFNELYAEIFAETAESIRRTEAEIEHFLPDDIEALREEINREENRCEARQNNFNNQFNTGAGSEA